ncbi:MAG: metallophosphoesterase [Alistipes sp.]
MVLLAPNQGLCARHTQRIVGIIDLLPLLVVALFTLLPDNTTALLRFAMWIFLSYLMLVLPRLIFYFFHHFKLRKTGFVMAIGMFAAFIWGATYGRTTLVVNEIEICSSRLPLAFDGMRIVQFSDAHIGTLIHPATDLQRVVDCVNTLRPDLVIFSGDLVNARYTELDTQSMRILSGIHAPLGVITTLGNHDVGVYVKDTLKLPIAVNTARLVERQQAMGWRLLDNQTKYLVRNNDTITISGISFDPAFRKQRHDRRINMDLSEIYKGVSKAHYNITISHLPQLWDQIIEQGYGDLTLSGHVHGMQAMLRVGKYRLSPVSMLYDRWSGLYEQGDHKMYINDGIGYVGVPVRLGAYPEITLFTLRK